MNLTISKTIKSNLNKDLRPLILNEQQEEQILMKAGFNNTIDFNKRRKEQNNAIEKYGPAISYDELQKVGERYGFVLSKPKRYAGLAGPETATKIQKFAEKHNLNEFTIANRFFVFSPYELSLAFKTHVRNQKIKLRDPILFYEDEAGMFHMVDQWGGDMNLTRVVSHMIKKQSFATKLFTAIGLIDIAAIYSLIKYFEFLNPGLLATIIIILLVANIVTFLVNLEIGSRWNESTGEFLKDYWNSKQYSSTYL